MSFDVQVGQNRDPYLFVRVPVPEQTHTSQHYPF